MFCFSSRYGKKIFFSQHGYDAPKQVVVTKANDLVFETDALERFLVYKLLDLSG